jgi:NADH:ubiquinone oxidoreductase subunit E
MTNESRAIIRRLYLEVRSTYRVAEMTGLSRSTVRNIVTADKRVTMSPVGRPRKVVAGV